MSPLSYVSLIGLARFPLDFAQDGSTCLYNNSFVNLLSSRSRAALCHGSQASRVCAPASMRKKDKTENC